MYTAAKGWPNPPVFDATMDVKEIARSAGTSSRSKDMRVVAAPPSEICQFRIDPSRQASQAPTIVDGKP